ncbi:MAG: hypothetical protein RR350_02080 [Oscillibacter sp.]
MTNKRKKPSKTPSLRVEPEKRLCPQFDAVCINEFSVAKPGEMGLRILDNCCDDHIM